MKNSDQLASSGDVGIKPVVATNTHQAHLSGGSDDEMDGYERGGQDHRTEWQKEFEWDQQVTEAN